MMIPAWLSMDPHTLRITVMTKEPSDGDFPLGARGRGWPIRQTKIDEAVLGKLLAAQYTPAEQDEIHIQWWNDALGPDEPHWPLLPVR